MLWEDATESTYPLTPGEASDDMRCSSIGQIYFLAVLTEALIGSGRAAEGLAAVEEGLAFTATKLDRYYEAELHRVKGELLLAGGGIAEGEACFARALEVARAQEARSLELRAAISLARLRRDQGRNAEARAVLAPVYAWFTEGFATSDLMDARALLAQLG